MGLQIRELMDWVRRRKFFAGVLIVLTLAIGILIGTLISGRAMATRGQSASGATLLAIPDPVQLSGTFSAIAGKLEPAVVNISTTQVIARPKGKHSRKGDDFQDFFDNFFDSPDDSDSAERSLGSGVVVDSKGYILTNNHVVDQATKIEVTLDKDPKHYTAKVIGTDPQTDLAVIKIDSDHALRVARLGNSEGVQVGDWVLAFGSPFGLQATVTAGIVSAKDRPNPGFQFQKFIQTDAAINPGNSGGPLVNMAGEVIGINTAIYTGGRGFEGVGFALPANAVVNVYNQLVTTGKVTRGSIGISFSEDRSANPVLLKELGASYGIVVEGIEPGSPAQKGGIQPGDLVTEVNGHPVHTGSDLVDPIAATPIGQQITLRYLRDKQAHDVSLTVADRAKLFPQTADNDEQAPGTAEPAQFGLHVEDLTPELSRKLGLGKETGVIVSEVEPASFAEDIEFLRGDIISEVNHVPVNSLADYRREVAALKPGQDVLFKVVRRDPNDRPLVVFLAGAVPNE
ncbi:MAG: Do family serine endopeptidase [Candidatus Acidiferrales bacterium]